MPSFVKLRRKIAKISIRSFSLMSASRSRSGTLSSSKASRTASLREPRPKRNGKRTSKKERKSARSVSKRLKSARKLAESVRKSASRKRKRGSENGKRLSCSASMFILSFMRLIFASSSLSTARSKILFSTVACLKTKVLLNSRAVLPLLRLQWSNSAKKRRRSARRPSMRPLQRENS